MPFETIIARLFIAAILGFILGMEREFQGRAAGLRTQMIVSVASCLLMIISLELKSIHPGLDANSIIRLDPGRIASYAVAGIGFLGAGAILHGKGSVSGLTTAACLWAANGLGLAVGAGFIIHAVLATGMVLVPLSFLRFFERRIPRNTYWRIYIDFGGLDDRLSEISLLLAEQSVKVIYAGCDCHYQAQSISYELSLRLKSNQNLCQVVEPLRKLPGLARLRWAEGFVP